MNTIEQRIWDYLDGSCSEQERKRIEHLLATNSEYQSAYSELEGLHQDLAKIELDEPSMSFTRNVMDQIESMPVPGSVKSLVDKRIIYGIAAFFLVSIVALLTMVFKQIDWVQPVSDALPQYKLPEVDYSFSFNSTYVRLFFFADIVLGLYLLDGLLRKRMLTE
jgi:anti-sigma factor RsiW